MSILKKTRIHDTYIPDIVLKNEGSMVQTCRNINVHDNDIKSSFIKTYFHQIEEIKT